MASRSSVESRSPDLRQFLDGLTQGEIVSLDDDSRPPWFEPGVISEVAAETYSHFLRYAPRSCMQKGMIVCAENGGLVRLFWRRKNRHFARELTAAETARFSELSRNRLSAD